MAQQPRTSPDFDLNGVVKDAKSLMENPQVFSEKFCGAMSTQVNIRTNIQDLVLLSLKSDARFKDELKVLIREVDKEDWRYFLKRFDGLDGLLLLHFQASSELWLSNIFLRNNSLITRLF